MGRYTYDVSMSSYPITYILSGGWVVVVMPPTVNSCHEDATGIEAADPGMDSFDSSSIPVAKMVTCYSRIDKNR
eukprot:gene26367-biopygen16126